MLSKHLGSVLTSVYIDFSKLHIPKSEHTPFFLGKVNIPSFFSYTKVNIPPVETAHTQKRTYPLFSPKSEHTHPGVCAYVYMNQVILKPGVAMTFWSETVYNIYSLYMGVRSAQIAWKTSAIKRSHFSAAKLFRNIFFNTKKYIFEIENKIKKSQK